MTQIKVLLLTGQCNQWHNWRLSSASLRAILQKAGIFEVDTLVLPGSGEFFEGAAPCWSDYDSVLLDYEGDAWPIEMKSSFEAYVKSGGGLVVYHASNNAFADWPEFNAMIGLGGWGGRNPDEGRMIRWREGAFYFDDSPAEARHPPAFEFSVETREAGHPIMQGLPPIWLHAKDELYSCLRGPAEGVTVLATAYCPLDTKEGTGEHEPVFFTVSYGEGRVFQTVLGHVGPSDSETPDALRCVGFATVLRRAVEWSVTGKVSQTAPSSFPEDGVLLERL